MTAQDWITVLSIVVLIGFIVVLVYLIVILHRANIVLSRVSHLSEVFRSFVNDIVPAIVNVGTIATAVEAILRRLHVLQEGKDKTTKKNKTKK